MARSASRSSSGVTQARCCRRPGRGPVAGPAAPVRRSPPARVRWRPNSRRPTVPGRTAVTAGFPATGRSTGTTDAGGAAGTAAGRPGGRRVRDVADVDHGFGGDIEPWNRNRRRHGGTARIPLLFPAARIHRQRTRDRLKGRPPRARIVAVRNGVPGRDTVLPSWWRRGPSPLLEPARPDASAPTRRPESSAKAGVEMAMPTAPYSAAAAIVQAITGARRRDVSTNIPRLQRGTYRALGFCEVRPIVAYPQVGRSQLGPGDNVEPTGRQQGCPTSASSGERQLRWACSRNGKAARPGARKPAR